MRANVGRILKIAFFTVLVSLYVSCLSFSYDHDDHDDQQGHHQDHEHSPGRLVLALDSGTILLIDAKTGHIVERFVQILEPGSVNVGINSTGEFAFIVNRDSWETAIIDSGFYLAEHGGHYDLHIKEPKLLNIITTGAKPIHFQSSGGYSLIYNDDSGTMSLFVDSELRENQTYKTIAARVDHGAPVLAGESIVVGYMNVPEIDIFHIDGNLNHQLESGSRLHGSSRLGRFIVFGTMEGVVLVTRSGVEFDRSIISYPDRFPAAARLTHFRSHILAPYFMARGSHENILAQVDPIAKSVKSVSMPAPFRQFGFDLTGEYFVVLDGEGFLHHVCYESLDILDSLSVATPDSDYPAAVLTMDKRHAWVSDPVNSRIVKVDLDHMEIDKSIEIHERGAIGNFALMMTEGVSH